MTPSIIKVLRDWATSEGLYSSEIRFHTLLNPSQIKNNDPFVDMVFIIEVNGFFLDKEYKQPIKLHSEQELSIDRYNSEPEYINKLKKDINLVTTMIYAKIEKTLSSIQDPIYTSDPKFMK